MKKITKFKRTLLVFALIGGALLLPGCTSSEDKLKKASDDVNKAEQDLEDAEQRYAEELADFKSNASQQINDNDKRLAELKEELAKDKSKMKEDYEARIEALELKNAEMKMRMDSSGHISGEKWTSFKEEFNHDMNQLGKSLSEFTLDNK